LEEEKVKQWEILSHIYAKHNELDSLKKYADEEMLKIIEAKQDTLSDMEKLLTSKGRMFDV
jgi:hypothetical protein